ncbi:MAG TPA: heme NO-binding domain-containing protein [Longimicrobiaceae bacterium]|nr:heme NO-binding domain-containing protein [Longimicrobiaceae bacterium]
MHGIIFAELKKYVDARHGGDTWRTLLREAGLGAKMYVPVTEYPDAEAAAIVAAASRATGTPAQAILEDFGEFIAPDLLAMYRALVKPEWRTLEVLENTEETIHRVVRLKNEGARPPEIRAVRTAPDEVTVHYGSERRMCGVTIGIVRGMAAHYGEQVSVRETACMHRGADACEIVVRRA